jgi:hypothetical protein
MTSAANNGTSTNIARGNQTKSASVAMRSASAMRSTCAGSTVSPGSGVYWMLTASKPPNAAANAKLRTLATRYSRSGKM